MSKPKTSRTQTKTARPSKRAQSWVAEQVAKGAAEGEAVADREMYEAIADIAGRPAEVIQAGAEAFARLAGKMSAQIGDEARKRAVAESNERFNTGLIGHALSEAEIEARHAEFVARELARRDAELGFEAMCALVSRLDAHISWDNLGEDAKKLVAQWRATFKPPPEPFEETIVGLVPPPRTSGGEG